MRAATNRRGSMRRNEPYAPHEPCVPLFLWLPCGVACCTSYGDQQAARPEQRPQAWSTDDADPAPNYHRCHPGQPHRPHPRAALPHAPTRIPRYFVRAPFSLQTPVERSERVAGCWAVWSRSAFLRSSALHPEVRFAWSWVGYPSRRPKGCGLQSPLGPKVYP